MTWEGIERRQPTREPWHVSKKITISTIVGVIGIIASQIYQYGALNEKISSLEGALLEIKSGHVPRDTVDQMLIVRDVQIAELKNDVRENNRLLREILTKLPANNGG